MVPGVRLAGTNWLEEASMGTVFVSYCCHKSPRLQCLKNNANVLSDGSSTWCHRLKSRFLSGCSRAESISLPFVASFSFFYIYFY